MNTNGRLGSSIVRSFFDSLNILRMFSRNKYAQGNLPHLDGLAKNRIQNWATFYLDGGVGVYDYIIKKSRSHSFQSFFYDHTLLSSFLSIICIISTRIANVATQI